MMREQGTVIGRFKVSRLMEELGLICKQPDRHAYKQAKVERIDIPNRLNRQFAVDAPNQVWCVTSRMSAPKTVGITWRRRLICSRDGP
jgi:putative transposase